MKLDKINPNEKKKNKVGMIIGTSTIAFVTLCGICGWSLLKGNDKNVLKVAQSLISGPVIQQALEEKEIQQEEEKEEKEEKEKEEKEEEKEKEDEKNEEDGIITDIDPNLDSDTVQQLEEYLKELGFGYSNMGSGLYGGDLADFQNLDTDKEGTYSKIEALYALCNNIDLKEKPEYAENPGSEPEKYYGMTVTDRAIYELWVKKGKTNTPWMSISYGWISSEKIAIFKEHDKEYNKLISKYKEEKAKFNKWVAWRTARNQWINKQYQAGMFSAKEPETEWSEYTRFWARVAQKSIGGNFENSEGTSKEAMTELIDWLWAQIYVDGNEKRENIPDLCDDILKWVYDGSNEDDTVIIKSPEGKDVPSKISQSNESVSVSDNTTSNNSGTNNSGTNNSGTNNSGTNNSGTNNSGTNNSGTNNSGTNNSGTDDSTTDTAPTVKSLNITSPKTALYRAGQEIKLQVTFDQEVYGTDKKVSITKETAPSLYISFIDINQKDDSNIENRIATFESVSGKNLMYTYKIAEGDNGQLSLGTGENFKGTVYGSNGKKSVVTKIENMSETKIIVADTKAPLVESIESVSKEGSYKTGEEIEIRIKFNETIYANENKLPHRYATVPVLNISFGEGEVKNPSYKGMDEDGKLYKYVYKIEEEDRGTLRVDATKAFDGSKTIYDAVGNSIVLVAGAELTGNAISANAELSIIKLNKTQIVLDLNGTKQETLKATITPEELEITWSVADNKVATVDSKTGEITAVAVGETTITAKASDGTSAGCKVTVKDTTKGETKVTLNKTTLELDISGTKESQLEATVTPNNMKITWTSSNIKIVTVDEKTGKVTAVGEGTATITAKALDGTTATCKVTVTDSSPKEIRPTAIEFSTINPVVVLNRTKELEMVTKLVPSNSNTDIEITYESSDEDIATIDENGVVTVKKVGNTVIIATTKNGKTVATNLTVTEITDNTKVLGDVSGNQKVDTTDLLIVLRHIAANSSSDIRTKHQDWLIEEDSYVFGDIDGNGRIDITDALKLQRHMAYDKSEIVKTKHSDWGIKNNWTTVQSTKESTE